MSGVLNKPEKTYPKIQLTITVLTCVAACVAAYISWQNAAPEQRRTLADTEKIQEETAQLKQKRVASEPTLSLNYLYINSEGDRLIKETDLRQVRNRQSCQGSKLKPSGRLPQS